MSLNLDDALKPWDGSWHVEPPRGLRLVSIYHHTAQQLLAYGSALSNWQAVVLQGIVAQDDKPSDLQRYWLDRICREVGESEVAA